MARQKIDMEEMFRTVPEVPEGFEEHCYSLLPTIDIYYRRRGKFADCRCGKCGKVYVTDKVPERNEITKCPICGNEGQWEWMRITKRSYTSHDITLIQKTTIGTLVIRAFRVSQLFQQGYVAEIKLHEMKRYFLQLGDVYVFNNEYHYTSNGIKRNWDVGKGGEAVALTRLYPGWQQAIKDSCLKYCDVDQIRSVAGRGWDTVEILMAYANNPALEMYAKFDMRELVYHLLWKEGKTKLLNRRKKDLRGQLRIKDKAAINRFIAEKGDITLLKILQTEQKNDWKLTEEQERFLMEIYHHYDGRKTTEYLLKYMSLQKLINRTRKYQDQKEYYSNYAVMSAYRDYLQMRQELGYDMTNEVYLYPKNLKRKHDEMVKERNARKDKLHSEKMNRKYSDIQKRFKNLSKKYGYESDGYIIRPAMSAGEIIMEGRFLHHCVSGGTYLSKHNKGETSILFLRRKETPDIPYYTIEIKGNQIIQWYGLRDKKPDREIIEPWLDRYVEYLSERLLHRYFQG